MFALRLVFVQIWLLTVVRVAQVLTDKAGLREYSIVDVLKFILNFTVGI